MDPGSTMGMSTPGVWCPMWASFKVHPVSALTLELIGQFLGIWC